MNNLNASNIKKTGSNILGWFTIPPVMAILTVALARLLGGGFPGGDIDLSIWAMVWMLFIVMSVLYGLFNMNGLTGGLIPLQALAQGIILCPMALSYGTRMFEWLGVVLSVCGAIALVVIYNQSSHVASEAGSGIENDVKKIPVKFVITDSAGIILNISEEMAEVLDVQRENILNKPVSDFFSPVGRSVEINEKFWDISRKELDDGKRYYFEFKDKALPTSSDDADETEENGQLDASAMMLRDPETGLHTYNYGLIRLDEDLYRAGRYKRELTGVLIRVVFPNLLPDEDMTPYHEAFIAYCRLIKKDIRISDTIFEFDDMQVLIILSECSPTMAETVVERHLSLINALASNYESLLHATIMHVTNSVDGEMSDTMPTAREFVETLREAMTRKYSAQALSGEV